MKLIDKLAGMDRKALLSTLWIFAVLNYLYCDILGLMDAPLLQGFLQGNVEGMVIDQGFLLAGGVLMEIPIAMVLLSRVLDVPANRWANIIAGTIMTLVQIATLFVGTTTMYYSFFSFFEITATVLIVLLAWTWPRTPART